MTIFTTIHFILRLGNVADKVLQHFPTILFRKKLRVVIIIIHMKENFEISSRRYSHYAKKKHSITKVASINKTKNILAPNTRLEKHETPFCANAREIFSTKTYFLFLLQWRFSRLNNIWARCVGAYAINPVTRIILHPSSINTRESDP